MTSTAEALAADVSWWSKAKRVLQIFGIVCVALLITAWIGVIIAGEIQEKHRMDALRADYPGVNLQRNDGRASVTYFAGTGHDRKKCRAGINPLADVYTIKPYHQRGVCRQTLIDAMNRANAP